MQRNRRIKIVELLISQGYVTERQILKVFEEQKKTGQDIASLIVEMGFISHDELTAVLGEHIQITHRKRIGELLIDHSLITPEQLSNALKLQNTTHDTLGQCLIKLKYIDESTILDVLGAQLDTPHVVLEHIVFNRKLLELVPLEYIEKYKIVPLFLKGNQLTIAMADPTNLRTRDHLRFTTGKEIDPVLASESSIDTFIRKLENNEIQEIEAPLETDVLREFETDAAKDYPTSEYGRIVVNIVNNIVYDAIQEKATDVHIEPLNDTVQIRYRIDGVLVEKQSFEIQYLKPIISRLKILSGMDLAEKRIPQEGKFHLHHPDSEVDICVSTYPMISTDRGINEKIVLRILDSQAGNISFGGIGFPEKIETAYRKLLQSHNGLILVTGPTESGKSSTLYASLKELHTPHVNIVTMEDPVKFSIEGIAQGEINPKAGFTFAAGMRSLLSQDPDIIMISEIDDEETCGMAIKAALNGRLVFSSLHTNDAPSAIARLLDMNIEPYLITSSVRGILAQRLVRRICPHCKEEYTPSETVREHFGYPIPEKLFHGKGCPYCENTGYKGRTAIFELLIPNDAITDMVMKRVPAAGIRRYAIENRLMETLRYSGFQLVQKGVTTLEEVILHTETDIVLVQP